VLEVDREARALAAGLLGMRDEPLAAAVR
jgi:hypothetical protein